MSIIEQAARRLDQLRRSGIDVPTNHRVPAGDIPTQVDGLPGRLARLLEQQDPKTAETVRVASPVEPPPSEPAQESRRMDIDLARLASMGYLTPDAPRSRIADEFRVIKRPLLANVNDKTAKAGSRNNLIMVTSSLPGEGKTFVSVNLAISLAMELEKSVLLVDADVSRPSVLSRLGLTHPQGLLDVMTDSSVQLNDVLIRTNIDKLTVLPAGKANGRATELIGSDAMSRLLDELANRYPDRIVIFDAPPLLPSTESRVLASYMGQVVLVVEAERTLQRSLKQAMATLEQCPIVLPLLNKISRSEVGSYYGYYAPA